MTFLDAVRAQAEESHQMWLRLTPANGASLLEAVQRAQMAGMAQLLADHQQPAAGRPMPDQEAAFQAHLEAIGRSCLGRGPASTMSSRARR